jgi:hypothetical protein
MKIAIILGPYCSPRPLSFDKEFSDSVIQKCRVFALQNTWESVVQKLEDVIKAGRKS